MEFDRTASPNSVAQAARWQTTPGRPSLPGGHYLRAAKWYSLADAPEATGLRLRHDLLAAVARLQQDGIWDLIHFVLLDWLSRDGQIDWSRAVLYSCSVRAVFGAANWAKSDGQG